jgi:putative transcriptional regulator
MKRVLAFAYLLAFLLAAGLAQAQTAKPLLLVASPALEGLYSRTTLVVVPAGEAHLGFIVNRATDVKLAALFPQHAPSAKVADPVYFGGPEMTNAVFAVVRRDSGAGGVRLFGDLLVVSAADAVDRVIEEMPNDARYFAGFVGWQPGELAKEIEAGYWHVAEPDAALFFRRDTARLWDELIERLGNGHGPQRGRGFYTVRTRAAGASSL